MNASSKTPLSALATSLLTGWLATQCFAVDHFIGVNFTGANAGGAPTSLDPADSAGVMAQVGWNNFGANSVAKAILSDEAGNLTGIKLSYLTGEMWGSGTGSATPNDKLFNGYLNSQDPTNSPTGTNTITFTNLSPANTYTVIAYTLRDIAGAQAAYWVNENYAQAFVILTEDASYWVADPTFRRGTNTARPATELANYVRWDGVAPRPNGTISVNVASEYDAPASFYRGPINGIQLISTNSWPTNSSAPVITLQPVNLRVAQGQSGTFQLLTDGPWSIRWFSNNVPVPGATSSAFTTAPLLNQAGTTNQYFAVVSNNVNSVTSSIVHLVLLPPLPPGGIFYDPFDYVPGPLLNQGDWTPLNTAGVSTNGGLSYTDSEGSTLQVSGQAMISQIDWDPFSNMPLKIFGTNSYGGDNTTNYMSYVFDFRNLSTNNSGYIGVSGFDGITDFGNERFFVGKRWYNDFIGYEGNGAGDSAIPYRTNGFLVIRLASADGVTTMDMFFDPPLSGLTGVTPVLTVDVGTPRVFNAVGVNAGEWDGPLGAHRHDFTAPGPMVDEFRFGTTYASVAPATGPKLTIQLVGSNVQISWPTNAPGYTLQQRDSLTSDLWISAPAGNPVTIPASQSARFFRLIK